MKTELKRKRRVGWQKKKEAAARKDRIAKWRKHNYEKSMAN